MALWGIDLGGTKLEGVVLEDDAHSKVLARTRLSTEAEKGYEHILGRISALVEHLEAEVGTRAPEIGIGTPGVLDPSNGTLKNSNTLCLNGRPLKADLLSKLGRPVTIANDANCFALAESRLGAGKGHASVFGVILGTGVGGGVVIHGRALHGSQGIAGEWGHNVLDESGPPCYCGKRGCVEMLLSGPRLEEFYRSLSGEKLPLAEVMLRAKSGETAARATLERLTSLFGKAISTVINILDPDVIILGGGVSNVDALYTDGAREAEKYIFNSTPRATIRKNALGDSAGVFGAALLTALEPEAIVRR